MSDDFDLDHEPEADGFDGDQLDLAERISQVGRDLQRVQSFDSKLRIMMNMEKDPIYCLNKLTISPHSSFAIIQKYLEQSADYFVDCTHQVRTAQQYPMNIDMN